MKGKYWGEGGAYGPFDTQDDGWPRAGQVMRYFRQKANLSPQEFGILYSKETGDRATERWIIEMEQKNKVPVSITRRRIIAKLLNIPPALLGLAVVEDVAMRPQPEATATFRHTLKSIQPDTTKYQSNIQFRWKLHATSNGGDLASEIDADILKLNSLANQAKGDFLAHVQELEFNNYILAEDIASDKRQYGRARYYANESIRVANAMNDPELLAVALFTRGYLHMRLGLHYKVEQGQFIPHRGHLQKAANDFTEAMPLAHPQLKGLIATQLGRVQAPLGINKAIILTNLNIAADMVQAGKIDDPYTRTLVTGTFTGFHEGRFLTEQAVVLNAAGLPGKALQSLNRLETLSDGTYRKDETRRWAWIDLIRAESYMGLREYDMANSQTKKAVNVLNDIDSVINIAIATDIYHRLKASSYGNSRDVAELGDMLATR